MKKLLIYIFLFFFGIFLCIPLLFSVFSHHMNMGENPCIEHCLVSDNFIHSDVALSNFFFEEFSIIQITYSKFLQEIYFPLSFLFLFLLFIPPDRRRSIKNYNYSSLIGIIKLTN